MPEEGLLQHVRARALSTSKYQAEWTILAVRAAEGDAYRTMDGLRRADRRLFRSGTILFGAKDIPIEELSAYLAHNYGRYLRAKLEAATAEDRLNEEIEGFVKSTLCELKLKNIDHPLNGQTIAQLVAGAAGPIGVVVGEIAHEAPTNPMLLIVALQEFIVTCGAREGVEMALTSRLKKEVAQIRPGTKPQIHVRARVAAASLG